MFSNNSAAHYHVRVTFQGSIFKSGYHLFHIFETECKTNCFKIPSRHGRPSSNRPHGQTFETIGARTPCHLFQKSVPEARHDRPSIWNNRRKENAPFGSKVQPSSPSRLSVHGPPPRPTLTDFWNNRREESVPFVSKVHPSSESRQATPHPPKKKTTTKKQKKTKKKTKQKTNKKTQLYQTLFTFSRRL